MRYTVLTLLLMILTLTTSSAEEITTNNILNQTFTSGNNWSGQLSSNHGTGIIAGTDGGYIENTEAYSLVDDVGVSTDQLSNGFTSNQSGKVWFWNSNNQNIILKQTITNSDGDVTVQTKIVTGSCATFNGCSYQDTGSNTYSVGSNSQTDYNIKTRFEFNSTPSGSASYSGTHRAADFKQPILTVTYDDTVLDTETSIALDNVEEALEDLQEEVFYNMEEFFFEEEAFTFYEEPQFEMEEPMEMEMFTFAEEFIEEFFMEIGEAFFIEDEGMEFEDGPMITFADTEMMEEIYEESNEIIATFLPMVSEEEEFSSEETFVESDGPFFMESTEETFEEEEITEEPTEMVEEDIVEEEESTAVAEEETIEEEPTEIVEATNEEEKEEVKEEESDSETPKKSTVQTKKLAKQKKIQQKKAIRDNLVKIMDKIDKDVKDISKNLQIKNIIKLDAMISDQVSLAIYESVEFYKPKALYLNQLNIFDDRQLYPDTNLASYVKEDPVFIKEQQLKHLDNVKQRLLYELEILKNG